MAQRKVSTFHQQQSTINNQPKKKEKKNIWKYSKVVADQSEKMNRKRQKKEKKVESMGRKDISTTQTKNNNTIYNITHLPNQPKQTKLHTTNSL